MEFEKYKSVKNSHENLDLSKYLGLNKDLVNNGINTNYKLIKHFFEYALNECRLYNEENVESANSWVNIRKYLVSNSYNFTNVAFIITASVRNNIQLQYLNCSIKHIRIIYPDIHIYIIDDNSVLSLDNISRNNIEIIKSIAPKAGELNPYLFILDSRCKHDKLVYIHDTVFLKSNIDIFINRKSEIDFLWYSNINIHYDTFKADNIEILNNLFLYFGNSKVSLFNFINMIKAVGIPYNVKFGCMSIFTKSFMEKIDLVTNIREVKHLFNSRRHRCFFERILSILYVFVYGNDYNISNSICGNIFNHPKPFNNVNVNVSYAMPLVKVWQGR